MKKKLIVYVIVYGLKSTRPPRRYRPPLKDSPTLKFRKKTQLPQNIPLQNFLNVNCLKSLIEAAD